MSDIVKQNGSRGIGQRLRNLNRLDNPAPLNDDFVADKLDVYDYAPGNKPQMPVIPKKEPELLDNPLDYAIDKFKTFAISTTLRPHLALHATFEKALVDRVSSKLAKLVRGEVQTTLLLEMAKLYYADAARLDAISKGNLPEDLKDATNEDLAKEASRLLTSIAEQSPMIDALKKNNSVLRDLSYDVTDFTLDRSKMSAWDMVKDIAIHMFNGSSNGVTSMENPGKPTAEDYLGGSMTDAVNMKPKALASDPKFMLNSINTKLEELLDVIKTKAADIADTQETLKQGSWWFDKRILDSGFRDRVANNKLSLTDPESWFYALPLLGSSLSMVEGFAANMGTSIMAGQAARFVKHPLGRLGIAATEAAANTAITYWQRVHETNSEIMNNYTNRVMQDVERGGIDLNAVLEDGKRQLNLLGVDTEGREQYDILSDMLVYNLNAKDPNFNKVKREAYKGMELLWEDNTALGLVDLLLASVFSYGGRMAANAVLKGTKLAGKANATTRMLSAPIGRVVEAIDGVTNKAMLKIATTAGGAVMGKRILTNTAKTAAKLGFIAASEAGEEGVQTLSGNRYAAGEYDDFKPEQSNLLNAFGRNLVTGGEAYLALMGLHNDEALNNDEQLSESMKIGGFIGTLLGGFGSVTADAHSRYNQFIADESVRHITALSILNKENNNKAEQYYSAIKYNNFEYLLNSLELIRDNFLPEGVTKEDVNEDIAFAKNMHTLYHSNILEETTSSGLGVAKGSEDFKKVIKNGVRAMKLVETYNKAFLESGKELQRLTAEQSDVRTTLHRDLYYDYITNTKEENPLSTELFSAFLDNGRVLQVQVLALLELNKELSDRKAALLYIKKQLGVNVDETAVDHVQNDIKRKLKESKDKLAELKQLTGYDPASAAIFNNEKDIKEAIVINTVNKALLDRASHRMLAYVLGKVFDYNAKRDSNDALWSTLSSEKLDELLESAKQEAIANGKPEPTRKSVIAKYNLLVQLQSNIDNELRGHLTLAAVKIIKEDLARYKENEKSYNPIEETKPVEDILEEEHEHTVTYNPDAAPEVVIPETPQQQTLIDDIYGSLDEEAPEPISNPIKPLREPENDLKPPVTDDSKPVVEDKQNAAPKVVEDEDDAFATGSFTEEPDDAPVVSDPVISATDEPATPFDKFSSDVFGDGFFTDRPDNVTTSADDLDGDVTSTEVASTDALVDEQQDELVEPIDVPDVSPERPIQNREEPSVPIVDKPVVEAEQVPELEKTDVNAVPENSDIVLDKNGNVFVNGVQLSDQLLAMAMDQLLAEAAEDLSTQSINNASSVDPADAKGITSSKTLARSGKVGKTVFYLPNLETKLDLPFTVTGQLQSSRDLGIMLSEPNALDGTTSYYVVGDYAKSGFDPNDINTWEKASIYLIIHKGDKTYAGTIKTPRDALDFYNRRNEKNDKDVLFLAARREAIIRAYLSGITPSADGTVKLPLNALKHVKPIGLSRTNGLFNTQKDADGNPIYRNLRDVKTFAIPEDPNAILDEVEFGYGLGPLSDINPNGIQKFDKSGAVSAMGKGYSGRIYIVPKVENTPSGRYSAPVMLSEKKIGSVDVKLEDVKLKSEDGVGTFAEFLYDLFIGNTEDHLGILDLVLHTGKKTRVDDYNGKLAPYLLGKEFYLDPETNQVEYGIPNGDGTFMRGVIDVGDIERNKELKRRFIHHIARNLHWTTPVNQMLEPISEKIKQFMLDNQLSNLVLFKDEIEFDMSDVGLLEVNGLIVESDSQAPPLLNWYIKNNKLVTDVGETAFIAPFLYAEDFAVDQAAIPEVTEKKVASRATRKNDAKADARAKIQSNIDKLGPADESLPKVNRRLTPNEVKEAGKRTARGLFFFYGKDGKIGIAPDYKYGVGSTSENEKTGTIVNYEEAKLWLLDVLGLDAEDVTVTNAVMRMGSSPEVYAVTLFMANELKGGMPTAQIRIFKEAKEGVLYHEAFHYVNLLVHSEREQLLLYDEFVKVHPEYAGKGYGVIEEAMAEDFRSWMFNQQPSRYRLVNAYKAIKRFVLSLFNKQSLLDSVYSRIRNGKYKNATLNKQSVDSFVEQYQNGAFFSVPGLKKADQAKIPNITSADIFYNIVDSLTSTAMSVLDIRTEQDVTNLQIKDVLDMLQMLLDNGMISEENIGLTKDVIDNYSLFHSAVLDNLRDLNIVETIRKDAVDDEVVQRIAGDTGSEMNFDRVSYEVSKKLNLTFNAKLFFYSIPNLEYAYENDESGALVRVLQPVRDSLFDLPTTVPFDVSWNKIMSNLWNIENYQDMLSKINVLSNTDPFFKALHDRLQDNPPSENEETLLEVAIKSAKNRITTLEFAPVRRRGFGDVEVLQESGVEEKFKKTAGDWSILSSDALRVVNKYPAMWSKLFYTSGFIDKSNAKNFKLKPEMVTAFNVEYKALLKKVILIAKGKYSTPNQLQDAIIDAKYDLIDLLNAVGIPLDISALDYMLDSRKASNKGISNVPSVQKLYEVLTETTPGNLTSVTIGVMKQMLHSVSAKKADSAALLSSIYTGLNKLSIIALMAIAYSATHPNPAEFSVTGPHNTTVYPITENNYMSDKVRWLNNDPAVVNEALTSSYNKSSKLLNNAKSGKKVALHTFISLQNGVDKEGRKYFELSPTEEYLSKMTFTENDYITLPTMADKPTWYAISGIPLHHDLVTTFKLEVVVGADGVTSINYVDTRVPLFSKATLNTMYDYFVSEFNAIVDYYASVKQVEANPDLYVKNYHGKIVKGKMDATGNGGRFRYFTSIYAKTKSGTDALFSLNTHLYEGELAGDIQSRLETLRSKLFTKESRQFTMDSINRVLQDAVANELRRASQLGLIAENQGKYSNVLLPANLISNYNRLSKNLSKTHPRLNNKSDAVYSLIANHTVNTIISINEVERAFTGDPAYYTWFRQEDKALTEKYAEAGIKIPGGYRGIITEKAVDKIKRLGSVLSTGQNLRTYWGPGDPRNNTKFTVLNLKDNVVKSNQLSEIENKFIAAEAKKRLYVANNKLDSLALLDMVSKEKLQATLESNFTKSEITDIINTGKRLANAYSESNQADAAVYIRPEMYKRIAQALGEWSPQVEESFNMMESDNDWLSDPEMYSTAMLYLIKPLKMVYFGDHVNTLLKLNIPVFDKMAVFPMFKVMANSDNRVIYDRMNDPNNPVDMIAFESAVKVGSRRLVPFYKDSENTAISDEFGDSAKALPTYEQDLRNLRLQLNTDPHEHVSRSYGTLAVKIGLSNIIKDHTYGSNKGKAITGTLAISDIMGAIKAISNKGVSKIKKEYYNKDGSINQLKLSNFLVAKAIGNGMPTDQIEALRLDENGNFGVPLSALSSRKFVESSLISQFGKDIIDIDTPGGSAIQVPHFGYKETRTLALSDVNGIFNGGKTLKFDNPDGSIEVMLSSNFFRHVVPIEFQTSFTAMRDWLIEKRIIGNDAKPFAIGYRIPTQGLSSMATLKVADIVPSVFGDTVILPDEFTAMTGSDYDIDKLYIASYWYDEKGERIQFDHNNTEFGDKYRSNSSKANSNLMLETFELLISDNNNYEEAKAPLDNLTNIMKKEILPLVAPKTSQEAASFYETTPSFQLDKKIEYSMGKAGIASFALHSNNHALTQAIGLVLKTGVYQKRYGLHNTAAIFGEDGYRISDWLSSMINAHVDVAKDPYVIALNVNPTTWNITNFLLRTGKGMNTFYFLPQEALRTYVYRVLEASGVYGMDPSISLTKYSELVYSTLVDQYTRLAKESIVTDSDLAMFNNYLNARKGMKLLKQDVPKYADAFNVTKLKRALDLATGKALKDFSFYYTLLLALKAFSDLEQPAERLNELVQCSQIDTKKYGNTMALQANFHNKVLNFINSQDSHFYIDSRSTVNDEITTESDGVVNALDHYFKETFLSQKLNNITKQVSSVLNSELITATYLYREVFQYVLGGITGRFAGTNGKSLSRASADTLLVQSVADAVEVMLRVKSLENEKFGLTDVDMNEMLFGDFTMAVRVNNIKQYLRLNSELFPDLVDAEGNITNVLLNYLQPVPASSVDAKDGIDKILLFNSSMSNSANFENRLTAAFSDLLDHSNEQIRSFADDLAKYAFVTSNDMKGHNTFFHIVPMSWKLNNGYDTSIADAIDILNHKNQFENSDVITEIDNVRAGKFPSFSILLNRNNWDNPDIVKQVRRAGGSKLFSKYGLPGTETKRFVNGMVYDKAFDDAFGKSDFVKVEYINGVSVLYMKAGVLQFSLKESGAPIETNPRFVYIAIPKLGIKDGSDRVYEYHKQHDLDSAFAFNNLPESATIQELTEFYTKLYKASIKGIKAADIETSFFPNEYMTSDIGTARYAQVLDSSEVSGLVAEGMPTVQNDLDDVINVQLAIREALYIVDDVVDNDIANQLLGEAMAIGQKETEESFGEGMFADQPDGFSDNILEDFKEKSDNDPSNNCK